MPLSLSSNGDLFLNGEVDRLLVLIVLSAEAEASSKDDINSGLLSFELKEYLSLVVNPGTDDVSFLLRSLKPKNDVAVRVSVL
ncbi:unnamed protein product [Pneumocystis jirovecii]|uniref:Uncharacterized protein n=1 Tax=Pneumocystis jirovecii TaxID=42068 RepID=L0PA95_PNEJI|nr:unnamed protein product [Pneumocystis jirovecii]